MDRWFGHASQERYTNQIFSEPTGKQPLIKSATKGMTYMCDLVLLSLGSEQRNLRT